MVLRLPKEQNSSTLISSNEVDRKFIENILDSFSSYVISSTSELLDYQYIFIPNLVHELKALTTINL